MTAIAAVGKDNGIGKNNDLIYDIPEDKKFFRSNTLGKTIIMGRKTLESMPNGRPLPKRRNIVITRNTDYVCDGAETVHSTEELTRLIADVPEEDVFVIGGAEIYSLLMPLCNKLIITHVSGEDDTGADKFFPEIDMNVWAVSDSSEEKEHEGLSFRFVTYEKK